MIKRTLLGFLLLNAIQHISAQSAVISGVVSDISGHGITSASVIVNAADGLYTITDDMGKYELTVPPGQLNVKYRSIGKEDLIKPITIADGRKITLDVTLKSKEEIIREQQIIDSIARKRQEDQKIFSIADSLAEIKADSLAEIKALILAEKKINKLLRSTNSPNSGTEEIKKSVKYEADSFNEKLIAHAKAFYNDIKDSAVALKNTDQIKRDVINQTYGTLEDYNEKANMRYAGQEKGGKAHGKGIMIIGSDAYDGIFMNGNFQSGFARIHEKDCTFYITYSEGKPTGLGYKKFNTGDFQIGQFEDGKLKSGIIFTTDSKGDSYLGRLKNGQKIGYCELKKSNRNDYFGLYETDKPVFGYVKEVDQLGFENISRIIDINKSISSQEIAKPFFDELIRLKK